MKLKTELDRHLIKLIQVGDMIETPTGRLCPATSEVSERVGTAFYQAIVPVLGEALIMPIHCYAIKAVWRGGVCLYRQGETELQRELL